MTPILEVQDLVKRFGDFTAVDGVSFDIQEGEVFSLLGPNGAGKTTTISMLSCLLTPTQGDAIVGGHSITKEPMACLLYTSPRPMLGLFQQGEVSS